MPRSPIVKTLFDLHGILQSGIPFLNKTLPSEVFSLTVPYAGRFPDEHEAPELTLAADAIIARLDEAVRLRVQNIPPRPPGDSNDKHSARLAVLFSGGLDCTVLALIADSHLPRSEPIDLLNVAFENPRALEAAERQRRAYAKGKGRATGERVVPGPVEENEYEERRRVYGVPDRLTGLEAVAEL